jgi:hypothetical protein
MIDTTGKIAMHNGGGIRWVAPSEVASWEQAGYVRAPDQADAPVAAILRPPKTGSKTTQETE